MKKPNQAKFLDLLIDLKDIAQWTQREIAQRLGVGENYISRVKRGSEPSARLVLALEHIHKEQFSEGNASESPQVSTAGGLKPIIGAGALRMAESEALCRGFEDVSDYLRYLIRSEFEARNGAGASPPDVEPDGDSDEQG